MGLSSEVIPHLRLTAERGLGEIDLQKISVDPKDYSKWVVPFEPPPSKLSIPFPNVMVYDEGSCSACLSTLLVFFSGLPFKAHGLSFGGSKHSCCNRKASGGLSEGNDSDRKLLIEDERSGHLYSGMPTRRLSDNGSLEDMNKKDRTKRGLGVKDSSG
jgi:hypothetical protein